MKLRTFQKTVSDTWAAVAAGKKSLPDNKLIVDVFPGGGKSLLPVIAAKPLMDAGLIEGVAWLVPRKSLQKQGAEDCMSKIAQDIFGGPFEIMETTNENNPSKGTRGFITTYQALSHDISFTSIRELKRKKYLLVLDEFHHLPFGENSTRGEEGKWTVATRLLWDCAAYKMAMTGTSVRHPAQDLIAWMDYQDIPGGKKPNPHIRYTLGDARRDKAIIDTEFLHVDGKIDYFDHRGTRISKSSLDNTKDKREIRCILDTQYQYDLIDRGLESWSSYAHRGGMLIVSSNQDDAKMAWEYILKKGVKKVGLATSKCADSDLQIERFRRRELDVICTCEMAYEGMNAPHADHLVYLHIIRSHPWLTQCLARVMRCDYQSVLPYEKQKARAIVPDDGYMNDFIQWIKGQQENVIEPRKEYDGDGVGFGGDVADPYMPITGAATKHRGTLLFSGCDLPLAPTPVEIKNRTVELLDSLPLADQQEILAMIEEKARLAKITTTPPTQSSMTPRQRVQQLKTHNETLARKLDKKLDLKPGTWNGRAMTRFGKGVGSMSPAELEIRKEWLRAEGKRELAALKMSQK